MKFGQLIEYCMKNIFLEKLYRKCGGRGSLRAFHKNTKIEHISGQQPDMLYSLFLLYLQVEIYQNIFKLQC